MEQSTKESKVTELIHANSSVLEEHDGITLAVLKLQELRLY